jgi:hypothetical protein
VKKGKEGDQGWSRNEGKEREKEYEKRKRNK